MSIDEQLLIGLYAEVGRMTNPECLIVCQQTNPYRCCEQSYCELAMDWADEAWGVKLEPLAIVPELPMMGLSGCTLEPHLRPICTMHTCEINAFGCKRGDEFWTKEYFALRDAIDELELRVHGHLIKGIR